MIGTFESWKPLMLKDGHSTWINKQGRTLFNFIGVIDGQEGMFSSTKNEPIFKIGEQVSYEVEKKEGRKYPKFSIKKLDASGKPYEDKYNKPESVKSTAYQLATELVLHTVSVMDVHLTTLDDLMKVAKYYYNWLIEGCEDDRNTVRYVRYYALRNAIVTPPELLPEAKNPYQAILTVAEKYIEEMQKVIL
jgi:hypothetical protein